MAQRWEAEASAVAAAASAGNDCQALQLAGALRDHVVAAAGQVPRRLRSPLLTGVNSLADRITCTPPPAPPSKPHKPPKPPHDEHGHHGPHKHGGDGNDQ